MMSSPSFSPDQAAQIRRQRRKMTNGGPIDAPIDDPRSRRLLAAHLSALTRVLPSVGDGKQAAIEPRQWQVYAGWLDTARKLEATRVVGRLQRWFQQQSDVERNKSVLPIICKALTPAVAETSIRTTLCRLLRNGGLPAESVRMVCAALAPFAAEPEVADTFVTLLNPKRRNEVGEQVAVCNGLAAAAAQPNICAALRRLFNDHTQNRKLRCAAAETLAAAAAHPDIHAGFLACLQNREEPPAVRKTAAWGLKDVADRHAVQTALRERWRDRTEDWAVRCAAAAVLTPDGAEPQLCAEYLACLTDPTEDGQVREVVAHALTPYVARPDVRHALRNIFKDQQAPKALRVTACRALTACAAYAEVRADMVAVLTRRNESPDLKIAFCRTLVSCAAQPDIADVLTTLLDNPMEYPEVRFAAAETLLDGHPPPMSPKDDVLKIWLKTLTDPYLQFTHGPQLCAKLTPYLTQPATKARFLELFLSPETPPELWHAVCRALGTIVADPEVCSAMLRRLDETESEPDARRAVVKTLAPVGEQPEVRNKLIGMLRNGDAKMRQACIEALFPDMKAAQNGAFSDFNFKALSENQCRCFIDCLKGVIEHRNNPAKMLQALLALRTLSATTTLWRSTTMKNRLLEDLLTGGRRRLVAQLGLTAESPQKRFPSAPPPDPRTEPTRIGPKPHL